MFLNIQVFKVRWPKSVTAISILLMAISIYSRQFRSFIQGNFNFFTATLTAFFASLTTCQLRLPTETKSMADKTQNQKWIVKVDLQREKWKSQSKVDLRTSRTRGYLHETGTNSDWYEFVSVSIHFFSCVYRPKNELRPVWLHLGRWPDTSYFRAGLRPYRSHTKQTSESQSGSINSMFFRMALPFLLFLSKNRSTAANNISKQDLEHLEVASMLGLMWGIEPFWDAVQ